MCVVAWLFDVQPGEGVTLRLGFSAADARAAAAGLQQLGALGAVRRAQAAKQLLDQTYPDTQPQDYDQVALVLVMVVVGGWWVGGGWWVVGGVGGGGGSGGGSRSTRLTLTTAARSRGSPVWARGSRSCPQTSRRRWARCPRCSPPRGRRSGTSPRSGPRATTRRG